MARCSEGPARALWFAVLAAFLVDVVGCTGEAGLQSSTGEALPSTSTSGDSTAPTVGTSSGVSTSASSTTSSTATSTSMGDVSAASDTVNATTPVHDVGWDKDVGDATPAGCKGKIDFLFVMSEHFTLKDEHAGLAAAFPKWIETI